MFFGCLKILNALKADRPDRRPPERESVLKRLRQLQAEGRQRNQPGQRKKSFLKLSLVYNRNTYSNTYDAHSSSNNDSFYICVHSLRSNQKRIGIHQHSG